MKWLEFPRKPAWSSRDPAERLAAVGSAAVAEIGEALPAIACEDADEAVRAAAVARLADLELVAARLHADPSARVRAAARARLATLLGDSEVAVAARLRWIEVSDDAELLRVVATSAEHAELRRAAIVRIDRPAFLLERCRLDPDPALRLELLARIDDPAALDRLAEATRRSDKRLAHAARERAEALRLARGDHAAWRRRTFAICERLDALRRAGARRDDPEVEALAAEWARYASALDSELGARVRGYLAAFDPPPAAAGRAAPEAGAATAPPASAVDAGSATADAPTGDGNHTTATTPAADPELAALVEAALAGTPPASAPRLAAQRAAIEARFAALPAAGPADRALRARYQRHAAACAAALARAAQAAEDQLSGAVDAYADAVAAGNAVAARRARRAVREARAAAGASIGAALRRRIETVDGEFDRLARWQHWSNNKLRARWCDEFEAWLATRPHPDAVATRVRELKAEWARLDALEHDPGEAPREPGGLDRRLHALVHRALAPARAYFDKRKSLRGERHAAIEALLAEAVPGAGANAALAAQRRRVVEALRMLDSVDPAARAGLGKRLRARLAELDALRAAAGAEAAEARRRLIAQTRRALTHAKPPDAIAIAREARERFRALPRAARADESALEAELEALLAPCLAQAEAARAQREAAESAVQAERAAILAELKRLAAADDATLRHADAAVQALRRRWEAAHAGEGGPDRPGAHADSQSAPPARRGARRPAEAGSLRAARRPDPWMREFDAAAAAVTEAAAGLRARQAEATRRQWRAAADWCAALEAALLVRTDGAADRLPACLAAAWPLADAHDPLSRELQRRRERALAWMEASDPAAVEAAHAQALDRAQELAIRAEIVRGAPSPEACRSARRALEVARLQARMAGGSRPDPADEARAIEREWLLLGPLDPAEREAYGRRITGA